MGVKGRWRGVRVRWRRRKDFMVVSGCGFVVVSWLLSFVVLVEGHADGF